MKEKLCQIIRENTENGKWESNHASNLASILSVSRNWISQHLNDYYNEGLFIKVNTRPVCFLDKEYFETTYSLKLHSSLFSSFDELNTAVNTVNKKSFQKLIGYNGSLKELVEKCKASLCYPPNGLPVLLHGETGSGKSYIAKLMYEYAKENSIIESQARFIHLNCSEFTHNPELLTANLFGYCKGAFTGAESDNHGLIKAAEGGILFLDEVHCLKPDCQEKLFLFMDNGTYHMLGDNEQEHHSNTRLLFATTEDPKQVLLKTMLRRIPITLEIPSVEERGRKEKEELLLHILKCESTRIKRKVMISKVAYEALLGKVYVGNIEEMKNTIQTTCMNALFHKDQNPLEINMLDLPDSIVQESNAMVNSLSLNRREMISLDSIKSESETMSEYVKTLSKVKDTLLELQNNHILMKAFIDKIKLFIDQAYNETLFTFSSMDNTKNNYIVSMIKKIIDMASLKFNLKFQTNEINTLVFLLGEDHREYREVIQFSESNKTFIEDFSKIIEKKYIREYAVANEIAKSIEVSLDYSVSQITRLLVVLCMDMYHKERDINKRIGVILAHGYATASSIANAVNHLLDDYVFDAIDMPLDVTTEATIKKLNDYLNIRGEYKDLILLVDMGSLESIYSGISSMVNANVAIANNVNTKFALSVGSAMKNGVELETLFEKACNENKNSYTIFGQEEKEKVILCSCATGIRTAEKLRDILLDSLPDKLPLQILTYDYSTLLENKLSDDLFKKYEVICIVGTLNPNIDNMTFIPIEELIMQDSFEVLTTHFENLISDEDMEIFRRNILKNFSLTNIIENLTILNPSQLLEKVAEAIDRLQVELNTEFSYNVCFGLYVHICCLIERLVTQDTHEDYSKTIDECSEEEQKFIQTVHKAFKDVENYYSVSIEIEEVEYIKIYIDFASQEAM